MSLPSWWPQWGGLVTVYSQEYGVDPALVAGVIQQESGGNPGAESSTGNKGLMQIGWGGEQAFNPSYNIQQGVSYLAQQIHTFGSIPLALAAYNAGPGAVQKYGGIPPYAQTRAYVPDVLGWVQQFAGSITGASTTTATRDVAAARAALEQAKLSQADQQLAGLTTATPTDVTSGLGQVGQSIASGFQVESQLQQSLFQKQSAQQAGLFSGVLAWANAAFQAFERFLWILFGILLIALGVWVLVQSQNPVARAIAGAQQ